MRDTPAITVPVLLLLALLLQSCVDPGWSFPTGFDSFTAAQGYDLSGATAFLSVAAVSLQPDRNDKAANLAALRSMVERVLAERPTTDVIVFNELCTSWLTDPGNPSAYFASMAEPVPGPSTAFVSALAALHSVTIVFGMAEAAGAKFYNSQVCTKPDGSLVTYRKRGLNSGDIANGCVPGDGVVTTTIKGIEVTFAICSDYQSEAVISDISRSTVPVVLMSLVTATVLNPGVDYFARAIAKWVVYANGGGTQGGLNYPGNIFIADPTGTVHDPHSGPGSYSWFRLGLYQ
jgi:predicted amidohydrolase